MNIRSALRPLARLLHHLAGPGCCDCGCGDCATNGHTCTRPIFGPREMRRADLLAAAAAYVVPVAADDPNTAESGQPSRQRRALRLAPAAESDRGARPRRPGPHPPHNT